MPVGAPASALEFVRARHGTKGGGQQKQNAVQRRGDRRVGRTGS
jgi:hypothetical protein